MLSIKAKRAGTVPAGRRAASMLDVIALAVSLIFILAACASLQPSASGTPDASAAPAETGTASPDASAEVSPNLAAPPTEPLTDGNIMEMYTARGLFVAEIRDAGAYTMVHYFSPDDPLDKASRFDWFDRKTGERTLVCGLIRADMFEITADKALTVLTTGLSTSGRYQQFPRILRFGYSDVDGAFSFNRSDSEYFMPLERSFSVGINRPECLKSVCYDGSSVLLTFTGQPGNEHESPAGAEAVPRMTVSNEDGVSTVTIFNTIPADDFVQTAGKLLGSDPCPVTVSCDGTDTTVTFKMRPDAARYNISCFTTPVERIPHAVITYETGNFSYPKGW